MLVDHLIQYRTSPWPKTVKKRDFCTCATDGPMDRQTDRQSVRRTKFSITGFLVNRGCHENNQITDESLNKT